MKTVITSDPHFQHANIIKYCNRPFANVKEHDETLIKNWNSVATNDDTVYCLGDMFFGEERTFGAIFDQLQFGILYVIQGNHDKGFWSWCRNNKPKNVVLLPPYYRTKINGHDVIMCHYPIREWDKCHRGSYHLYGHVHGGHPVRNERSMDVGVDANNYKPYTFEEIHNILKDKPAVQHHDRN